MPTNRANTDTPIACTLTSSQYHDRTAELAALAAVALRSREPIADGDRLTFARGDDVEHGLEAAIAAEAACCPFLSFRLHREDTRLVLDVTGPELAQPIIAALFAARSS